MLQDENPIDVAAVGGGEIHDFPTSASGVVMKGAGRPSLSSAGALGIRISPLVMRMKVCGM